MVDELGAAGSPDVSAHRAALDLVDAFVRGTEPTAAALEEVRPEHPAFTEDRGARGLTLHGGFAPIHSRREAFSHRTDVTGLCAYVASITFVGLLPQARRAQLLGHVAALVAGRDEPFEVPMFADVWHTRRL